MSRFQYLVPVFLSLISCLVSADEKEIRVGMSTALSGPQQDVGYQMRSGVEMYFNRINQEGGVDGQKLKLVVKDDGYEPLRAAKNMHKLIDKEDVLAVIGNVGTPTAVAAAPIAKEKKTLLYGAFSGSDILRGDPRDRYILNYRASYAQETKEIIDGLLSIGVKPEEIAFFTQRDAYGDSGFKGAVAALKEHDFHDIGNLVHARYTRNTLNVEMAVASLMDAKVQPKAVIIAGSFLPAAKFIKLAKREIPDLLFLNLSGVSASALVNVLRDEAEGVVLTQVVPHYDSDAPLARQYREDLEKRKGQQACFVSYEGYIVAKLFVDALEETQGSLDKEKLIDAFHDFDDLDIGIEPKISYAGGDTQAVHEVWPMIYQNSTFSVLDWQELKK